MMHHSNIMVFICRRSMLEILKGEKYNGLCCWDCLFIGQQRNENLVLRCLRLIIFNVVSLCLYVLSIGSIQTSVNQFTGQGLANWPRMACGDAVWVCFFLCLFAEEIKQFLLQLFLAIWVLLSNFLSYFYLRAIWGASNFLAIQLLILA